MKKIKHYLQLWDGIWSIPLAFTLFVLTGLAGQAYFGLGFAAYDPAIFQAALVAAGLLVFFNAIVWLGMYMNFRQLYRFYRDHSTHAFNTLTPCQKLCVLSAVYAGYLLALLLLTLHLA
jgi:uncharacterized membrane protein